MIKTSEYAIEEEKKRKKNYRDDQQKRRPVLGEGTEKSIIVLPSQS